jgi:hypothetical protein
LNIVNAVLGLLLMVLSLLASAETDETPVTLLDPNNPFGFPEGEKHNYTSSVEALKAIVANTALKNKLFGKVAQTNLHDIYEDEPKYKADNVGSVNLSDGKIGPVTEKWLAYFSAQFLIDAEVDNADYAQQLFQSLVIVAQIQDRYFNWRDIILTNRFKQWAVTQDADYVSCDKLPGCYGTADTLHHLLDDYDVYTLTVTNYVKWVGVHYRLSTAKYDAMVAAVDAVKDKDKAKVLTADQLPMLEGLINVNFAQLYLLDVALKMAGLTNLNEAQRQSIVKAMQRQGAVPAAPIVKTRDAITAEEYPKTAIWQPTEDCNCAQKITTTDTDPNYFYGFYPYWRDATDTLVNFEQLTRIGYFAASLDGENDLSMPQTWNEQFEGGWQDAWQNEQPYSEMVAMAHKYRVKVDLVIANQRTKAQTAKHAPNYFFSQALVRRIVSEIKTPLAEQFVNPLKPIVSLTFSPARTKADGVTLDLDLHELSGEDQINHVAEFIKSLKDAMMDTETEQTSIDDRYYLNMMVPVSALLTNAQAIDTVTKDKTQPKDVGFYTFDNLQKVSDSVNVFIMVFDPLAISVLKDNPLNIALCTDLKIDASSVGLMKCLRRYLGHSENEDVAGKLHAKMVPLLQIYDDSVEDSPLQSVLNYNSWSYQGAAYWDLPLGKTSGDLISATYFPTPQETNNPILVEPVLALANQVCDRLCPNRWGLRVLLFTLVICIALYAFLSIWIFNLREFLTRWYSLAFMGACSVFLMSLFTCDPYWQEQQHWFFIGFIVLFIAALWWLKMRADEKAKYP